VSAVSIVIITRNEACNITDCILSAKKVSNDIIVIDSGSTDETMLLAEKQSVKLQSIFWQGYGYARNTGAELAVNDWILSLDADERITDELADSINRLDFDDNNCVYGFRRLNYFNNIKIRYGALAHDRIFRIYHRKTNSWNTVPVHETLTGQGIKKVTLKPRALHYGIRTKEHYLQKKMNYAGLCALKYREEKPGFILHLRLFSPIFNFVKAYFFQLGFLDKRHGLIIARINAAYTRKKYSQLQVLLNEEKNRGTNNSEDRLISFAGK
jgi:glycosyltransferase involved in cell wall biosynthesis